MNALLLPGVTLLGIGAFVLLTAYLFRRGRVVEATIRLVKIGAFLVVLGSALSVTSVLGDAVLQMPELTQ